MSITIPQPFGGLVIPRARTALPVLTYIGRSTSTFESSTITIPDVNIGPAAADRLVVVCAMCNHANNGNLNWITGGSIGGSSATLVVGSGNMTFAGASAILSRLVTSGTTATVVINLASTVQATAIDVYTIRRLSSTTAFHSNFNQSDANTNSIATTLNIPAGGCAIGCHVTQEGFSTFTATWSGLTEDADSAAGLSHGGYTSASGQQMSAQTGRNISVTVSGFTRRKSICVASWI